MAKLKRFSGTPVSEGIRLEVGKYTVFAVRNAQRDISVRMRREPRKLLRACMHIPFLRGVTRLLRDIYRFFDGLGECAELNPHRPACGTKVERALARLLKIHPQNIVAMTSAPLIVLILFIGLYAAPEGAEALLRDHFDLQRSALNLAVCGMRVVSMLMSVGLICRLRGIRRLCMYKGALNKAINCYECRDELTLQNVSRYPIHARRSESAFLLTVLAVSMVLFAGIPLQGILVTLLIRIAMLLAAAAVVNELFCALESAPLSLPVRILRAPMDLLQYATTLEPQSQMLEVVLCAFEAVLAEPDKEVNSN